jgi:hypothetical protein
MAASVAHHGAQLLLAVVGADAKAGCSVVLGKTVQELGGSPCIEFKDERHKAVRLF